MKYQITKKYFQYPALLIIFLINAPHVKASAVDFLKSKYWDAGKAEFQVYEAKISRYGIAREALAKIIIVKEPFDMDKMVKTNRANAPDVIKMNYVQTVPTGVYDYFQMASFFFARNTGKLLKYTMSSQDGCGNTFMQYRFKKKKHDFIFHSYFDDEGDIRADLEQSEQFIFYDALPIVLRFRLKDHNPYHLKIVPSLINSRFVKPVLLDAEITNRHVESIKVGNRQIRDVYEATVKIAGRADRFYFESVFPNRLVQWTKHNGDELILNRSRFFYYWKHTGLGDGF